MTETSELSDVGAEKLWVAIFRRALQDLNGRNEQHARNAELFLYDERTAARLEDVGIDADHYIRLLSEMGPGRRRRRRGQ